jgi:DNA processing protein
MTANDTYHWLALRVIPLVGTVTFHRLLSHFGSPARALQASGDELRQVPGLNTAAIASLLTFDPRPIAERECRGIERSGVRLVTCRMEEYPPLLREIHDPPPFLYVKGSLAGLDTALAIVGSRRASSYGVTTTRKLAAALAGQGVAVVSGLARGIDTAAHEGVLQEGGHTVAILGCGVDVIYPPENRRLYGELAERGAVVSEFALGTRPVPENFPRRNRIISGISRGVLVVEATERSGSLITAQFALDQGRDVFAVPGNITSPGSLGTNRLIKQGARLVESAEDVVEELAPGRSRPLSMVVGPQLAAEEAALCTLLADGPLQIDDLHGRSGLTVSVLSAMLLRLELQGVVMQLPGKTFALS